MKSDRAETGQVLAFGLSTTLIQKTNSVTRMNIAAKYCTLATTRIWKSAVIFSANVRRQESLAGGADGANVAEAPALGMLKHPL